MDIIVTDHSKENLERIYGNQLIFQNDLFSIMVEETKIPWLQFIPNKKIDADYIAKLYQNSHQLGEALITEGLGDIYNIAKIGNKLPYYHIHLVLRNRNNEAWPDAIWCKDDLESKKTTPIFLRDFIKKHYQKN